ncbi:Na(+)-translocating NADH-quinone reductase subunit C [Psychrosphaera sp. B3R10]|uniref:Na(+)-translocating NADH-quinone reductase subunit C n=1 Tax=unclassified Psychrosphaera TaxID=2641570 RepID=UPI001C096FC2|nr:MULTISPECIES: Na(+)-translocating NADH-quinone reductase subunit C [unclassified Psychrosphaera]MBU2882547.1 Na(+)-translocating NADH-quinone reductase subunit C [Psychrosphaera sp. I2R16]MBU2989435.1 Na(+)-translocating NADH-quinone reductase subunit C [Psychrosphaera sp. B3R10]MDO6718269.1 Na(+)-translocating NADH-quinone reductase subunit C [Psychrosphaera sp. 1_MG-2023]
MSNNKETFGKTVGFVFAVCIVCAALVSVSAVQLKPRQVANKLLDKQTLVLEAAGLQDKAAGNIVATYNKYVEARMIDLETGKFVEGNPDLFEERRNARDPKKSEKLANDPAGINRQANEAVIYLVHDDAGKVASIVLPIVGSGLWDLMYGYVGLEADLNTVKNVVYSDHKETPGLGAEVMNPKWKALWPGKRIYNGKGEPVVNLVKGGADANDVHGVDALSGATLTSNGVTRTLQFWFGEQGYKPFIAANRGSL